MEEDFWEETATMEWSEIPEEIKEFLLGDEDFVRFIEGYDPEGGEDETNRFGNKSYDYDNREDRL